MKNKIKEFLSDKGIYIILIVLISVTAVVSVIIENYKSREVYIYNSDDISQSSLSDSSSGTKKKSSSSATKTTSIRTSHSSSAELSSETNGNNENSESEEEFTFPADINKVTYEQLIAIKGIGDVTANKILDYRSDIGVIYNMDLLTEISGIGDATLELLKEYLYVSDEDYKDITDISQPDETEQPYEEPYEEPDDNTNEEEQTHTAQTTAEQPSEPVRQVVNINTADADEISQKLLIDIKLAENIVALREQIHEFSDPLELLYADGMTQKLLSELKDYVEI